MYSKNATQEGKGGVATVCNISKMKERGKLSFLLNTHWFNAAILKIQNKKTPKELQLVFVMQINK